MVRLSTRTMLPESCSLFRGVSWISIVTKGLSDGELFYYNIIFSS